jgi:hypothetical protein
METRVQPEQLAKLAPLVKLDPPASPGLKVPSALLAYKALLVQPAQQAHLEKTVTSDLRVQLV